MMINWLDTLLDYSSYVVHLPGIDNGVTSRYVSYSERFKAHQTFWLSNFFLQSPSEVLPS